MKISFENEKEREQFIERILGECCPGMLNEKCKHSGEVTSCDCQECWDEYLKGHELAASKWLLVECLYNEISTPVLFDSLEEAYNEMMTRYSKLEDDGTSHLSFGADAANIDDIYAWKIFNISADGKIKEYQKQKNHDEDPEKKSKKDEDSTFFRRRELEDRVAKALTAYENYEENREEMKAIIVDVAYELKRDSHQKLIMELTDIVDDPDEIDDLLYNLLVKIQNHWHELDWKETGEDEKLEYNLLRKLYKIFLEVEFVDKSILSDKMRDLILTIAWNLEDDARSAIEKSVRNIQKYAAKPEEKYYEILEHYRDNWDRLEWKFKPEESDLKEDDEVEIPEEKVISKFIGDYAFLSNAYESTIYLDGIRYKNAEAAFQAQKVLNNDVKHTFSLLSAKEAKLLGQNLNLREDWEQVKSNIMFNVCYMKFLNDSKLKEKLLETGDMFLIATGCGKYWGTSDGEGENVLGNILMEIRDVFQEDM